jgi:hypothetical protein
MPFIAIVFLLIVLIGYLAWKSHQRTVETWRRVAQHLGLSVEVRSGWSRPTISGTLNGLPVRIDTYTQRSGNSSTTYTRYQVRYKPLGFNFRLKREGGLSFIGKLFGIEDVQVGDPVFDGAFKIKTSNQARLLEVLTPSVRSGLFRLMASYPGAVIEDDNIKVVKAKWESNGEVLTSTTQRLVATAQLLTSPTAGVSDDAVTDRAEGLLSAVAERIRQAVEEHPEDVDQRIFEVETLAAAGDEKGAAERVNELERLAPADPDVAGWKEALRTPPQTTLATPATADVNEMATELFGGDDLSFETRSKFNSGYAGAAVSWEGKVKQTRRVGDNMTVTVTVATVNNDLYGNTDIDVLVDVPAATAPQVEARVTVIGTLSTIDPLMRNLYVKDAALR